MLIFFQEQKFDNYLIKSPLIKVIENRMDIIELTFKNLPEELTEIKYFLQ